MSTASELGKLRSFGGDLWTLDTPFSMKGIELGARTTLVRLASGGLFLSSPGPLEDAHIREIEALGRVEAIVAPNTFHHLFLSRARAHFPEARVFLAQGLREKVPSLPQGEVLVDDAPELWGGTLEQRVIRGTKLNEVVFFHPGTRTLILTDMAFNIRKGSLLTRLFMKMNGGYGRFGPTRALRTTFYDEAAVRASVESLLDWDFDRVIVAHGEIVETGGKEALREGYGL